MTPVYMGFWRRIIIAILFDNDIKGITVYCMEKINKICSAMQQIGIPADDVQYLASGDDSDTFLCNQKYVAKIPKYRETETAQQKEFSLYEFLAQQKMSFCIPRVIYKSRKLNIMSFLSGNPISYDDYLKLSQKEKESLAMDEAEFLRELHRRKIDVSNPLFSGSIENKYQDYLQDYADLCKILKDRNELSVPLQRKIDLIYSNLLSNRDMFQYEHCLVHNDFSSDNMIFRDNRLYGVIDFGDYVVGDPDNDFLCILDNSKDDFGKDFGRRVLYYYGHPAPEKAERKAEINDEYWPIQQILFGNSRKDDVLFQKGISHLSSIHPYTFIF